MTRRYVQQMTDGDALDDVYMVTEKQLRANRQGNTYLQVELRDRTGSISARLWNVGEPVFRTFEEGDFLRVKGKVQLYQGSLQVILSQIEPVSNNQVELGDFLPQTTQDQNKLLERLRG